MNARLFSRHLPPAPGEPMGRLGWLVVAGLTTSLAIGLATWIYYLPIPVVAVLVFLTVGGWVASYIDTRRKRALASSRPGDALCAFARSMDLRSVDPWVVRATFEELQPYFPKQVRPFPILPGDRLFDDLQIDPEDIDDIALTIAARAGYSLDDAERNPLYGRVDTVGDLIRFFTHQPRKRRDAAPTFSSPSP